MSHPKYGTEHACYKAVLKAYGITYAMVAARFNMSYPYIANVLKGKAPLSWTVRGPLDKLVNGLLNPAPLDEALVGDAEQPETPPATEVAG